MSEEGVELKWMNALEIGLEGKGWEDTHRPYDRLPRKAQAMVPEAVWNLSRTATGMCIHFRSDAYQIHARWEMQNACLGEGNFPVAGYSGLDLYGDDQGTWRWVAATQNLEGPSPQVCIANGLDGKDRAYCLYLPLRNPLEKLEIGVPVQSRLDPIAPRTQKSLVVYGTSIVHGAYGSHAGVIYPSLLGRRLNLPVINLGFSGNARMEIEVADLLAELEAQIYLLDPLPNMDTNLVSERAEAFLLRLRARRPHAPIVLVEDFPRTNAWIKPELKKSVTEKNQRVREITGALIAGGMNDLTLIEGDELLGTDNEASLDCIHPSDLGYMRMADRIEPVLAALV